MALIQARVKLTNGDGKVYAKDSSVLNVNKNVSALPNDLRSDKLLVIVGTMNLTRFYFVAGDKLLVEKTTSTTTPVVTKTGVINVTKTGWQLLSDLAPTGFKESESGGSNLFSCRYYIEPVEYTGDRYYSTASSLERISSINFCKRLIYAASELAPAGIKDPYASMYFWGETNPDTGVTALVIPATMDDISGLFDNAATISAFTPNEGMPKIITLGKIKKMVRTFYNAFAHGMFTYSPPVNAVVFGEMDVSEVTDFSYCFGQCFQANPDIENWNVSSATNMTGMFQIVVDWTTDRWTRNLSNWCVSKITSEPANFALNHPMSAAQKPVWGTCPIKAPTVITPMGYYNAASGGSVVGTSSSTTTHYMRFTLSDIKAGTVLTLRAGPHGTPRDDYYTDFTVLKANGAIDSSNGVKTRMYGDGVPNKDITLTFTQAVAGPVEFVVGVNIWNYIYTMDKYGTGCTNYVYCNGKVLASAYLGLHW